MTKKLLLATLVILALFSVPTLVLAESPISINYQIVQDITSSEGVAEYALTLKNNEPYQYTAFLSGEPSYWRYEFEKEKIVLRPNSEETIYMIVRPPKDVRIGSHSLKISANDKNGVPLGRASIKVNIDTDITPLDVAINLPTEMGPAERIPFSMILENQDIKTLNNIRVTLSSSLFDIVYEFEADTLKPLETKTVNGEILAKPYAEEGKYRILIKGTADGKTVASELFNVNVPSKPYLDVQDSVSQTFLTTTHTSTLKNLGNTKLEDSHRLTFSGLQRFLITTDPSPSKILLLKDAKEYEWDINIAEGESVTLTYSISYVWPFVAAVVIVFLVVVFHAKKQQAVDLEKKITQAKGDEDGPKALKVQLRLKNNRNKTYKNVLLEDFIPGTMRLVEQFGTLKPLVVKREEGTTKLVWKFEKIGPKEERFVTYGLRAAIQIIGKAELQPAKVTFAPKDDTLVSIRSNSIEISSK